MSSEPSRRDFIRLASLGGATLIAPHLRFGRLQQREEQKPVVQYRTLGRTGLKVSAVGFGAMRTTDPSVIHYAIDLGVNYIDTAACYMGGNNEIIVGNVLKTRRKEVFIATKVHIGSGEAMLRSVEASLKRLQTDVIDVIQLHSMKRREDVLHEGAMKALERMREKGMVRFVGFSTHKNQVECIDAALESKFYDTILVAYNFKSDPAIGKAIERAGKAGIGIIAMKTQAGGYRTKEMAGWSPHQAALRWVLLNPYVATTIPSMVNFAQVEENVKAMGSAFGAEDQKVLERYGQIFDGQICRFCGGCERQCPYGVPVQDVNRALMYAEGYGDYDLALQTYRELAAEGPVNACDQCGRCIVECPYGLDLTARMKQARNLFAGCEV